MLFNGTLLFGYVPHNFGLGVVVPLIKDKFGDVSNTNNYAGITISSCTSKLFEMCLIVHMSLISSLLIYCLDSERDMIVVMLFLP